MSSLRDHLQAIYDQHGELTPELVVEEARPEDHPLHSRVFDRPPGEAAEAWYRDRAHRLIRSVKVTYKTEEEAEPQSVRAFHSVRSPTGYSFEPAEKVAEDPMMRALVLREMEREWRDLHARYSRFQEFAEMVKATLEADIPIAA